jgi:putative flippase GtrA
MNKEFVRSLQFLMVSFASAFSNLLYIAALSHLTSLPFWFISLTSTEFSMVVNFVLNDRITFRNLDSNRMWYIRLARFQVAAIGGNLLTAGISTFFYNVVALSPVAAQAIAIMLTFFVNFFVHRFWTFKGKDGKTPASDEQRHDSASDLSGAALPYRLRAEVSGVSVVIPVRNESATMRQLLLRLHDAMTSLGIPYEALIIDDHSTDDTVKAAIDVIQEAQLPASVLSKKGKPGKSFSLMEGFDAVRYPVLAMIDGDLELPPESLPGMVRQLARYDVVIGRRLNYDKNNSFRAQLSAAFNKLVMRLFLGIDFETQTGIKVFWKHVYESVKLNPGKWGFDMEFVAKALSEGFRLGEYETPFEKRRTGVTKVNPVTVAAELLTNAVRIKLDILQTAKANATLKLRAVHAPSGPSPILGMNSAIPPILDWLAPVAALLLFLRVVMGPAFFSSKWFFGLPGDTNQYMWFIGWTWHAIDQRRPLLVTSAFNYPHPITIMDYTSVPTLGLLFGWLYSIAGVVFTFNLINVVNYALILVFGKLILRALGVGRLMSSVGALLFCLMPYLTAQQVEHLNLTFISPLFMVSYALIKIVQSEKRPGLVIGALTGLALTLAFYTFIETTMTLMICVAMIYGFSLVFAFKATYQLTLRALNIRFLLGAIAPLLLIIPGVLNFLQGAGPASSLTDYIVFAMIHSNNLLSLVIPSALFLAHNQETINITSYFRGNPTEWDAYLSFPFIILIAVFVIRQWSKPSTRILSLTGLSMLVMSLGPWLYIGSAKTRVPLPWRVLIYLPILRQAAPSRLGLYALSLAIILVVRGIDELMTQARARMRSLKLNVGMASSLAALALVAFLWLPSIPSPTATIPKAAGILQTDAVVSRYINREPTLVLYNQYKSYTVPFGFSVVMGVLADTNNYDLVTSNIYGHGMQQTPSYQINEALLHDTDGAQTVTALRRYLPRMGVSKVMFVSTNDQPITPQMLQEISTYLGAPIYNNQGLVVVWNAP